MHTEHEHTDEVIIARIRAGETFLYGIIMDRYTEKLARYGRKFLADNTAIADAVQDIFTKAYEHLGSFDPERRFQPWIYRIAHNVYVNILRSKERTWLSLEWDTLMALPSRDTSAEDERERTDMRRAIEKGMTSLSPTYREVLTLHYLDDMPYKDIAEVLHVPLGTVSIRLKRAKEALKKELTEYDS